MSQVGVVTLLRTAEKAGLSTALSAVLSPWRKPLAAHYPGKVLLDLAVSVALGGDCLADIAVLREQPSVFGLAASDRTVSRLIAALAADASKALSRSAGPALPHVRARGGMPGNRPPSTASIPTICWSSIWTPR